VGLGVGVAVGLGVGIAVGDGVGVGVGDGVGALVAWQPLPLAFNWKPSLHSQSQLRLSPWRAPWLVWYACFGGDLQSTHEPGESGCALLPQPDKTYPGSSEQSWTRHSAHVVSVLRYCSAGHLIGVGDGVGDGVGSGVGRGVGVGVGARVGDAVGDGVGRGVGALVASQLSRLALKRKPGTHLNLQLVSSSSTWPWLVW